MVLHDIEEGVCYVAAVAALVAEPHGAVHEVLGTEGDQGAGSLLQLALQRTHSAEGPAGSTGTLGRTRMKYEKSQISFKSMQLPGLFQDTF